MLYHYTMCGLDYVHLRSGFRIHETEYGQGVSIERADSLDRLIAELVLTSQVRLRGQEVRFLRSLMHESQTELGIRLGLKRLTIARWESTPNTPIPGPADRALRIAAANELFEKDALGVIADLFPEIADSQPNPLVMYYLPDEEAGEPVLFPEDLAKGENWKLEKTAA